MTAIFLAIGLAVFLAATGWVGPRLLQHAAPALVRTPRLALALLGSGLLAWVAAALSLAPLLAWAGSGPQLLPGRASLVCEQCLQAANPFASRTIDSVAPASLLLATTVFLVLALLSLAAARAVRVRQKTRHMALALRERAVVATLQDTPVMLVDDPHPLAFTLPARLGGIVISTATLQQLGEAELRSVLAHERAHLKQQHHLIGQLLGALTAYLRWVPLINALYEAMNEYMEIAADDAARRQGGTVALAGALLKLGAPVSPAGGSMAPAILNAAGPGRIAHLVNPQTRGIARWPLWVYTGCLVLLGIAAAGVFIPYAGLAIIGCL